MPRILRIMNRLAIGGPLLNVSYLTKYLAPEYETMLVMGEKEDHEEDAGFITAQLGISPVIIPGMGRSVDPANDYKAYKKMKELIRDFKPDIVHTHAAKPGAIGRLAAHALKVPVIVHTFHGHVFHSYFNPLKTRFFLNVERQLAKRSSAIIAISEKQKEELSKQFKIAPPEKFHIVPLGLDLDKFQQDREGKRQKFRKELGIIDDEVVISIVGRLVPVKNHELFLKAITWVKNNTDRKIKAIIVGDGECRQSLEMLTKQLQISFTDKKSDLHSSTVFFASWRNDIDVVNAGSDIIALTSLNEGTPVSLIEAQAAARPVISTKVGGIEDVVQENRTGLLCDTNDVMGFSQKLLQLVEDKALRDFLGANGEANVLEKYSYKRLVSDMDRLYRQLLDKPNN